jgi:hypothetical protein
VLRARRNNILMVVSSRDALIPGRVGEAWFGRSNETTRPYASRVHVVDAGGWEKPRKKAETTEDSEQNIGGV